MFLNKLRGRRGGTDLLGSELRVSPAGLESCRSRSVNALMTSLASKARFRLPTVTWDSTQPEELLQLLRGHAFSPESQSCRACRTREMVHDGSTQPNRAELDAPCSPSHPGLPLILRADSAISCIRGHIDELFASGRQLPVILEQVARVGAQLLM